MPLVLQRAPALQALARQDHSRATRQVIQCGAPSKSCFREKCESRSGRASGGAGGTARRVCVYSTGSEQSSPAVNAATSVGAQEGELSCAAVGMEVECVVNDAAPSSSSSSSSSSSGASNGSSGNSSNGGDANSSMSCAAVGMEVECVVDFQPAPQAHSSPPSDEGLLARVLSVSLLVSPFFFWGTSMVAMKGVTAHTTPLFLGSLRLLPAGLLLVAWAAADGRKQPSTALAWAWVAAFALVDGAAFQGFLAQGLQRTSAGLGSVIIDSQPLSVALLAALLFGETLTPASIAGLFIGVAGLLLLEVPEEALQAGLAGGPGAAVRVLADAVSGGGGGGAAGWSPAALLDSGEFWMLLAAQSMALGTVMVRYVTKHADPVMATGWHMVLGGAALLAASALSETQDLAPRLAGFTSSDAAAMAYVSILGGAASYGIFFYNATRGSLTALSSLTFLTPAFAAIGGYAVLGETLTPLQLAGAGVTLGAVLLINKAPKKDPAKAKEAKAQ